MFKLKLFTVLILAAACSQHKNEEFSGGNTTGNGGSDFLMHAYYTEYKRTRELPPRPSTAELSPQRVELIQDEELRMSTCQDFYIAYQEYLANLRIDLLNKNCKGCRAQAAMLLGIQPDSDIEN